MSYNLQNEWLNTTADDLSTLTENYAWELEGNTAGRTAIAVRWIFNLNDDTDKYVTKSTARLVVKGFMQIDKAIFTRISHQCRNIVR